MKFTDATLQMRITANGRWQFNEDQTPHKSGFGGGELPFLVVTCGSSEMIHVCGNGHSFSRADARLVAAAPQLLNACSALLNCVDNLKSFVHPAAQGIVDEALQMANAALAKAAGFTGSAQ
jgi:hypothetical protein